jgi:hypothetical protein
MARTLTIYERSTPTYLFSITDMDASGVDIAGMKAMMCITFSGTKTISGTTTDFSDIRYIVNAVEPEFTYDSDVEVWADASYCRTDEATNMFAITVPMWKYILPPTHTLTSITYQVFMYSLERVSGVGTRAIGGVPDTISGRVKYHNILIDSGTIELLPSMFPTTENMRPIPYTVSSGINTASKTSDLATIDFAAIAAPAAPEDITSTLLENGVTEAQGRALCGLAIALDTSSYPRYDFTDHYSVRKMPMNDAYALFGASIAAISAATVSTKRIDMV